MSLSMKLTIEEDFINTLSEIIEQRNNCVLETDMMGFTAWIRSRGGEGDYENEFRVTVIPNCHLVISRVCFSRRRCGTMTALLSYIIEYCIRKNIPVIVVQSVQTYEMMQFCLKNKFTASPYNSMFEGVLMGDYILRISDFQAESTEVSRM